jgi:hypothetical protein
MPKTGSGLPTGSFKSTPSGVFNFAVLVFLAWSGLYWVVGDAHRPEGGLKTLGKSPLITIQWISAPGSKPTTSKMP